MSSKKPSKPSAKTTKVTKTKTKTKSDERRDSPDRRSGEDRRMFPRPEGRRVSGGRRKSDGTEA